MLKVALFCVISDLTILRILDVSYLITFHIFYFIFSYDSYLNVVSFKNRLMSYLCLNIVHILMLFHIFN